LVNSNLFLYGLKSELIFFKIDIIIYRYEAYNGGRLFSTRHNNMQDAYGEINIVRRRISDLMVRL